MDFLLGKNLIKKQSSPSLGLKKTLNHLKEDKKDPRASPSDDKCPICLVIPIDKKSFANRCFHSFCYVCILEWSKVRFECPLCRQSFDRIIYDVKSEYEFKELSLEDLHRIRYSGTSHSHAFPVMSPFLATMFQMNLHRHSLSNDSFLPNIRHIEAGTLEHRRYIYAQDLYVLPSNGSRSRESNSRFYRNNPSCIFRLIPFLNLELQAIIHDMNERRLLYQLIVKSLKKMDINSSKFQQLISQYTVHRTVHFIHELYYFAISVHESINDYFEGAIYVPRNQTTIVRINYIDNDSYDSNEPSSDRISRDVLREVNDNQTSPIQSQIEMNHYLNQNNETNHQLQLDIDDSSSDSDIDIVYEGLISSSPSITIVRDRVLRSPNLRFDDEITSNISINGSNSIEKPEENRSAQSIKHSNRLDDPKPSTSGLQNNRLSSNINSNQTTIRQYTDDSDSDYDDNYRRKTPRSPFFDSDDEQRKDTNPLNRDLAVDNEDSIEYMGIFRAKRSRISDSDIEIIEITDDESTNEPTNNGFKKMKTEDKDSKDNEFINQETNNRSSNLSERAPDCRCKKSCLFVCKKSY